LAVASNPDLLTVPKLVFKVTNFWFKGEFLAFLIKILTSTFSPTLAVKGQAKIKEVVDDGSVSSAARVREESCLLNNVIPIKTPKNNKKTTIKNINFLSIYPQEYQVKVNLSIC
jgi:hypothetical protein